MSNAYRTLSQHLNDLKKENFSLKLRIYFLEERIQQKFEDSSDDVYRRNIELKVEVESLKQDLLEKQRLLDKALTTAETLTNHNEAELQRRCDERQQEIDHMQQVLETKIQILQEEAQLARNEVERMASLVESQHPTVTMEMVFKEPSADQTDENVDRDKERIKELTAAVYSKERDIRELTEERRDLRERVRQMEDQLQQLSNSLLQKERDAQFYEEELGRERLHVQQEMQSLMEEQQSQLNQYECAAGQCVNELQKAQLQVQSLQQKIHESEAGNKKLQEKLCEMETELQSIRQAAQDQERTIQNLTDTLSTKDYETQELHHVIEVQNRTMQHMQTPVDSVDSVMELQSSLFLCQLQLEASQRDHRLDQRRMEDLTRSRDRLQADLRDALQHRETTEQHNQDLRKTLAWLRSELEEKTRELRNHEMNARSEITNKDKVISGLQQRLHHKHALLQEYSELLDRSHDSTAAPKRDALLDALRSRIKDRDSALEDSIDEKFRCLEEKDCEVRRLQLALREKDRDLERLNNILNNNNDTITSLDGLVRSKELDLERTQESCQKLKSLKQQSDEKHAHTIRERDSIIHQLQTALHTHSKQTEELRSALLKKVLPGPADVLHDLQSHLSVKERLFQEVMSERSRQVQEHHRQLTELLDIISSRDQDTQDYGMRLGQVISERSDQVQELRRQLLSREQELNEANRERERNAAVPATREIQTLKSLLKEKENFIQELLQVQSEVIISSTPADSAPAVCTSARDDPEIQTIKEELQLTLKKYKQTEVEVLELRSALAAAHDGTLTSDYQCFLQQLMSEQKILNESLRSETTLYQNLRRIQCEGDSDDLHEELKSLQALRGQLEEVLARTRATALAIDRAASLTQTDYGESSSDEDEDEEEHESSSEAFTDSIEDEDEVELTAQSLSDPRNAGMFSGPMNVGLLSQNTKEGGQCEDVDAADVMNRAECSSHTNCRNTQPSLHERRAAPNQSESGLQPRCELKSGSELRAVDEVSVKCHLLEKHETDQTNSHELQRDYQEEEEEEDEDEEDGDDEGQDDQIPLGKRRPPWMKLKEGRWKRRCTRPHSLDLGALLSHKPTDHCKAQDVEVMREVEGDCKGSGAGGGANGFWQHVEAGLREQAEHLRSDLAVSRQESRDLQERLMVSEAMVHALNEQLKDYRELLTESAVQRDSKQVQVDLQDLGYETSGRSENEAERENTSSPELDESEMCISLSGVGSRPRGWHGTPMDDDPASLKCLVQDLRAQLSHCHKVIRSLQLRVRSLSSTSDYASSLERTPRKVNWEFQASTVVSAVDEDEGWQSDGPMKPSKELQELVSRVAVLETQMKSSKMDGESRSEEGKCATWPGKYNTLIQAQARELSHLRQRMREGRGICHILTQHLSDTTKGFEELLRANDIDYYMGQSFREQLSQSSSLAQRVSSKISGRDLSEQQEEKARRHELLALRLSKELQQKDQIIESLHTKLRRRPDTPCSSHAPSETTDQSDHASFVSDERVSTNEDLDLCSDMDVTSEFVQEEVEPRQKDTGLFFGPMSSSQPLTPNQYWSANLTFDPISCLALEGRTVNGQRPPVRTFSAPHSLYSYQHPAHSPHSFSYTPPVPHHALGHSAGPSLQTHTNLMESSALWGLGNIQGFDGSSYFQLGNSQSGVDVIEEHLREIRSLRQRLEDSIRTNERLRQQLEGRLSTVARETVSSEEVEQLREAVLSGRARLKQAELEAEQWKEELRRLQTHNCDQSQQIQQLRQERQNTQEQSNRLQHEVSLLQQQLSESRQLLRSLQCELQLYERVCGGRKSTPTGCVCEVQYPSVELRELLVEIRALRVQLEHSVQENSALRSQLQKQLDQSIEQRPSPIIPASPLRDALYRRQLLHDPSPSPPVRDVGPFPAGPLYSPYSELEENTLNTNDSLEPHSDLEGEAPDGSFANRHGRHAIGHVDDYSALRQQVLEGSGLTRRMEAALQSCLNSALLEINTGKALEYNTVKTLLSDTKILRQILDEATSLLKMFWRAALPSGDGPAHLIQKEQTMRSEIQSLHRRIAEQEEVLQGTVQRLRSSNRTKESMETFIVNQLSRTRDVLKKARANLEKNELRISSLSSSSSSHCHGKILTGPSDRGHVTHSRSTITMTTANHRRL